MLYSGKTVWEFFPFAAVFKPLDLIRDEIFPYGYGIGGFFCFNLVLSCFNLGLIRRFVMFIIKLMKTYYGRSMRRVRKTDEIFPYGYGIGGFFCFNLVLSCFLTYVFQQILTGKIIPDFFISLFLVPVMYATSLQQTERKPGIPRRNTQKPQKTCVT